MSDVTTTDDQRLAALELAVAQLQAERQEQLDRIAALAAVPPIAIGPFTNVPAPGSPIRSDWPQTTAQYVSDLTPYIALATQTTTQRLSVQGNAQTVHTDGTSSVIVNFPKPFVAPPVVIAASNSPSEAIAVNAVQQTTNGFYVIARDLVSGAGLPNRDVLIQWLAIGVRPAGWPP